MTMINTDSTKLVTAFAATTEGGAVQAWTTRGKDGYDALMFAERERNGRPLFPVSREDVDAYIERNGKSGPVALKTENGWLLTTV